jgi:hypothetical protein
MPRETSWQDPRGVWHTQEPLHNPHLPNNICISDCGWGELSVLLFVQVEMRSYASRNQLAVSQRQVADALELEWDRRYLTVLGVANKRLYEFRLQTQNTTYEKNKVRRAREVQGSSLASFSEDARVTFLSASPVDWACTQWETHRHAPVHMPTCSVYMVYVNVLYSHRCRGWFYVCGEKGI